jgi:hypothetical protein
MSVDTCCLWLVMWCVCVCMRVCVCGIGVDVLKICVLGAVSTRAPYRKHACAGGAGPAGAVAAAAADAGRAPLLRGVRGEARVLAPQAGWRRGHSLGSG